STMAAILKEDPPDLSATNKSVSPGLERIVRHCLEKNPERRFQSARDLAFGLESLSSASGAAAAPGIAVASRRWRKPLVAAFLFALAAIALWAYLPSRQNGSGPSYKRLTFRRATVLTPRLAPH